MFQLTDNTLLTNGKCRYLDDYGNKAYMERNKDGFSARLRFVDKSVTIDKIEIKIPLPEELDGVHMELKYPGNISPEEPYIVDGLKGFTDLVHYWINLCSDMKMIGSNPQLLIHCGVEQDSIANLKYARMCQYVELADLVHAITDSMS